MTTAIFLAVFLVLGVGVIFVAFSGGPGRARENYLTRGPGLFRVVFPLVVLLCGLAVPALVIAERQAGAGAEGRLASVKPSKEVEEGKTLFRQSCWSCHTLEAAGARGNTGPNLDQLGVLNHTRVLNAIKNGGTGEGRMPANLLEGRDAELVADYVSRVAGK